MKKRLPLLLTLLAGLIPIVSFFIQTPGCSSDPTGQSGATLDLADLHLRDRAALDSLVVEQDYETFLSYADSLHLYCTAFLSYADSLEEPDPVGSDSLLAVAGGGGDATDDPQAAAPAAAAEDPPEADGPSQVGWLEGTTNTLEQWMLVIAGCALLLGVVNVFQMNLKKISGQQKGWINSIWLLLSLVIAGTFGLLDAFGIRPFTVDELPIYRWIVESVFMPLQATMFSLLAFYVASAAFRAFRARNLEAAMLLTAAMIIMLGVNPATQRFLPWLADWTNWIMDVPNAAAQRGIIIGAALGAASMALRILLGIERSYLGLQKGE